MREKEVNIGDNKFKIKELSWGNNLDLIDGGFTTRKFMELCIVEPSDFDFNLLNRGQGKELLKHINELNAVDEDFQNPSQEQKNTTDKK